MPVTLVKTWLEKIYIQQCTPQEMNKELKKIGCRSKMHGKFIAENAYQPDGKVTFPSQSPYLHIF